MTENKHVDPDYHVLEVMALSMLVNMAGDEVEKRMNEKLSLNVKNATFSVRTGSMVPHVDVNVELADK